MLVTRLHMLLTGEAYLEVVCRAHAANVPLDSDVQDLKHGHVLNATEDALNLSETNKRYQQQADELTRRRQVEARQMPGYADGGVIATAQAVKAQAIAVQEATEPVTGHSAQ